MDFELIKPESVLFRNDQWMLIEDHGKTFLAESRSGDPGEIVTGWEILAQDLSMPRVVEDICEKTWVNIDLFEQAYNKAALLGLIPKDEGAPLRFAQAKVDSHRIRSLVSAKAIEEMVKQAAARLEMPR